MSVSKIQKFLQKPLVAPDTLSRQAILVTSSKGFSLRRNNDLIAKFGFSIDFNCKAGARFDHTFDWITQHLSQKVRQYPRITLYIWIGTCDITKKVGKFISLEHHTTAEFLTYACGYIDRIVQFVSDFPTVKLVFLEIPPYSIVQWNDYKGHWNPQGFTAQDTILAERVVRLNEYIHEVNSRASVTSLNFKVDLLKYRKAGREPIINRNLFKDGIHPGALLARCWMRRLVSKIFFDCV